MMTDEQSTCTKQTFLIKCPPENLKRTPQIVLVKNILKALHILVMIREKSIWTVNRGFIKDQSCSVLVFNFLTLSLESASFCKTCRGGRSVR